MIKHIISVVRPIHKYFFSKIINRPPPSEFLNKKQKVMQIYKRDEDIQLATEISKLPLLELSVKAHDLLIKREKSEIFWAKIQNELITRMIPTTDEKVIRSYAKIIYCLSKVKRASVNYETQISIMLPFASPKSLTTIVTSLSRMGPFSQEFAYIIEKMYYKRKNELNAREKVSINYSLAINCQKMDQQLIQVLDSLNCRQSVTMLRCYDISNLMNTNILKSTLKKILAVQIQMNVLDLADIINIYFKYSYVPVILEELLANIYCKLQKNINDICLQKIWEHMPKTINEGKLKIQFISRVISTIEILRKSGKINEVIWKKLDSSFSIIHNAQLRVRLDKIY